MVTTSSSLPGLAVDIGSTIIKVAQILPDGRLGEQGFIKRNFDHPISAQLDQAMDELPAPTSASNVVICSSANGGLRVGIVCLTTRYSGTVLRNQSLLAGANPIFVKTYSELREDARYVDILLVGGGIDCPDPGPLDELISSFNPDDFHFGSLVFVGNRHLSDRILALFPSARIIPNPMTSTLTGANDSVFELLRNAYLDDLVHKKGISDLRTRFKCSVRPTPEVVNMGFQMIVSNRSQVTVAGSAVLVDIGGATTDLHYTTEIILDESSNRPPFGVSVGRYVFTDLGIVASRDSATIRLRTHSRCYEFLSCIVDENIDDIYRQLREGEWTASPEILAYACLFLALERFSTGDGPGLPQANLDKVSRYLFTGGAAQMLAAEKIASIISLISTNSVNPAAINIDRDYQIWVDGIVALNTTNKTEDSRRG